MAGEHSKRVAGWVLLILAALFVVGFLFVLFADSKNVNGVGGDDLPVVAIVVSVLLAIIAVVLAILLILGGDEAPKRTSAGSKRKKGGRDHTTVRPKRPEHVTRRSGDGRGGPEPIDLMLVPLGSQQWSAADGTVHPFHFPRLLPGGVYSNDYIKIGGGKTLRLRTMLAVQWGSLAGIKEDPVRPPRIAAETGERLPSDDFMDRLERRQKTMAGTGDLDSL